MTNQASLVPINDLSEFAGLPLEEQRSKISRAWKICHDNGVHPKVWGAPEHSFDGPLKHRRLGSRYFVGVLIVPILLFRLYSEQHSVSFELDDRVASIG